MSPATVTRWVREGRLHRLHRGVYAVGHRALGVEGRLAAALLYAGPGALLSHVTAAWWWQLWSGESSLIHVSSPRHRSSVSGVRVHRPRHLDGTRHRRFPVTTVARTALDCAAELPAAGTRRLLAEAAYRRLVDLAALEAETGPGRPGSRELRAAIARHQPQLARTRSVLEERFLELCDAHAIPPPLVNARMAGVTVDALWPAERLIVELDGHASHATPAALERDRARDLRLRAAGYLVLRYTWRQVTEEPERVARDLRAELARAS